MARNLKFYADDREDSAVITMGVSDIDPVGNWREITKWLQTHPNGHVCVSGLVLDFAARYCSVMILDENLTPVIKTDGEKFYWQVFGAHTRADVQGPVDTLEQAREQLEHQLSNLASCAATKRTVRLVREWPG